MKNVENLNLLECIEIVVKGGISVKASVAAESEAQDFYVLSAESVINEKLPAIAYPEAEYGK